jgi:hypothetical protein
LEIRSWELFAWSWRWTMILLIVASWVARIELHPAESHDGFCIFSSVQSRKADRNWAEAILAR